MAPWAVGFKRVGRHFGRDQGCSQASLSACQTPSSAVPAFPLPGLARKINHCRYCTVPPRGPRSDGKDYYVGFEGVGETEGERGVIQT